VQSLEAHDFGANPDLAVSQALIDVARFGVAQLCNIGPVLAPDDLEAMLLWAERHSKDTDGLIKNTADEINSRADIFAPTIKALVSKLSDNTVTGLTLRQKSLRKRQPLPRPDWHYDGAISKVIDSGIRTVFPLIGPEDNRGTSFLVSRLISGVDEDRDAMINLLRNLPPESHLRIPYGSRTAVLMAEGTGGMRVVCPDNDTKYGVESPFHAGWHDPKNPSTRPLLVVDCTLDKARRNNNAFRVPIPSSQLRKVA